MNKNKIILSIFLILLIGCSRSGNIRIDCIGGSINAAVNNQSVILNNGESHTWEIKWQESLLGRKGTDVTLYAESVKNNSLNRTRKLELEVGQYYVWVTGVDGDNWGTDFITK